MQTYLSNELVFTKHYLTMFNATHSAEHQIQILVNFTLLNKAFYRYIGLLSCLYVLSRANLFPRRLYSKSQ